MYTAPGVFQVTPCPITTSCPSSTHYSGTVVGRSQGHCRPEGPPLAVDLQSNVCPKGDHVGLPSSFPKCPCLSSTTWPRTPQVSLLVPGRDLSHIRAWRIHPQSSSACHLGVLQPLGGLQNSPVLRKTSREIGSLGCATSRRCSLW
jgi:hypothetical protein